jgi:selenocysteine lyase/cysteine desulfurase
MQLIPTQRHLFDISEEIAYFNCAYNSPQLNESKKRLIAGVESKSHPWERTAASFFEDAETIRTLAAEIFGGDANGYAVIPASSYGMSTAARAVEPHLKPGDRILLLDEEFPSNVLPWQRTAKETGARIITVPTPTHGNWTEAILARLNKSIKVVAISNCHWTNGAYIDVETIGEACHNLDCILAIDASQSLGAMPFSVDKVKPDFLVASGYKWLLCPYGFSLLYVSEQWRNARPLEESWLARLNAEDFTGLVKYSDVYMAGARRFDVGQKCIPTLLPGAIAAFEQIKAWGVDSIVATLNTINKEIGKLLEERGFKLPGESQRSLHILGAMLPNGFKEILWQD